MHRQHTQFSPCVNRVFTHRADRVAKAIERQGIRATYELHDRLLSNRTSRDRFAQAPPTPRRPPGEHPVRRPPRRGTPSGRSESCSRTRRYGAVSRSSETGSSRRPRRTSRRAAITCASGRARSSSCGCRATEWSSGPDRSVVQGRRLAAPARPREHVPQDVVEARVRRRLVLEYPRRRQPSGSRRSAGTATTTTSTS